MNLLAELAQLTKLRHQREKTAQQALEQAKQTLRQAQLACEHQVSKIEELQQQKATYQQRFNQRCAAEAISMAILDEHRQNLVLMDKDVATAQFELEQLQKAQTKAEEGVKAAQVKLVEARKAIDKIGQAAEMAKTDLNREADQHTDRQEEEVLEAMVGRQSA